MKKTIRNLILSIAILPSFTFALCPNFVPGQLSASALNNAIASPCITSGTISNVSISSSTASNLILSSQATTSTQAVRLDQIPSPYRNRLINGDMQVSQLNAASAVTPTTTDTYPIDQWKVDATQASKLTFQQVVDAPSGFKYSEKITVASQYAPLATDRFAIYQPIEGQNLIDFGLGTASPSTLAMSLWLKCSTAGTYAVGINNAGTRSYVSTVSCTTSWAKQTVVLIGDNTGTWATDNTIGAQFYIDLGSGTNFNTTSGSWQAGDFTRTTGTSTFVNLAAGQTFQITGAQFEQVPIGAISGTYFEFSPYETQLRRSQRYLEQIIGASGDPASAGSTGASSTTDVYFTIGLHVPMRVPPTSLIYSSASDFLITDDISITTPTAFSIYSTYNSIYATTIHATTAGGLVQYRPYKLVGGTANARMFLSSQL